MSFNVILTNKQGEQILPITVPRNIKIAEGYTLEDYLNGKLMTAGSITELAAGVTSISGESEELT